LLTELKEDKRFGEQRLNELAEFYNNYLKQQFGSEEKEEEDLTQPQYWIALAFTDSKQQLSQKIAKAIELRLKQENWKELFRLASFIEAVPQALVEFEAPLIHYVRGMLNFTTGDLEGAAEEFNRLPRQKQYMQSAGVNVPILDPVSLSPFKWGNSSLTLYAFHLRNSINQGLKPTVTEAPQLWEQLVDLGNKLHIAQLQTLPQQLICYQDNQYFPQAEDSRSIEYFNLLRNQNKSLNFRLTSQTGGSELQGLLCPFRLHDTYAIDLTLSSKDKLSLQELRYLNPQDLLLPPQIQASLGQTLLLFGQPIEQQENYQDLADACVNQILSEINSTEFVSEGYLLGNPIFEYESTHTDPTQKLHILVWLKCQDMNPDHMDKVAEIILYLLWFRHKIQYVYHQSRWCDARAKQLYGKLEEYRERFNKISQGSNQQSLLSKLLGELRETELEYVRYLGELADHENTITINEQNYSTKLKKLELLPKTNLNLWQQFLDYVRNKLQQQIQIDIRFLKPGRERLEHLKATVGEAIVNQGVESRNLDHEEIENEDYTSGIPSEIYGKLRNSLSDCEQFDSVQQLRNFFRVNASLTPWRDHWQAGSPSELVDDAIGYLNNKYRSDTNENALVILVRLLAESIDPTDSRHQTLVDIAQELSVVLSRNVT
jgi:hypothetical protein